MNTGKNKFTKNKMKKVILDVNCEGDSRAEGQTQNTIAHNKRTRLNHFLFGIKTFLFGKFNKRINTRIPTNGVRLVSETSLVSS